VNDLAKLFAAAAGGAFAMHLYRNYQAEQMATAQRARLTQRSTGQKLVDTATSAFRDFVPASQVSGMAGHMPMPQPPFPYHAAAPYQPPPQPSTTGGFPRRAAAQASAAPPPPPPTPDAENNGTQGEFEIYSDDNLMGGQRF
jgi:hypothetical protein